MKESVWKELWVQVWRRDPSRERSVHELFEGQVGIGDFDFSFFKPAGRDFSSKEGECSLYSGPVRSQALPGILCGEKGLARRGRCPMSG